MINRFCVEHAGRPGRRWPVFATLVADGGAAVAGPQEPIRLARPQNGVVGGAQGHVPHRRIVQADAQEAAAAGQIRSVPVRFQVRGTLDGRVPAVGAGGVARGLRQGCGHKLLTMGVPAALECRKTCGPEGVGPGIEQRQVPRVGRQLPRRDALQAGAGSGAREYEAEVVVVAESKRDGLGKGAELRRVRQVGPFRPGRRPLELKLDQGGR